MQKKISKKQIERLFAFTKQHYVEYFDLQLELVDHLAIAIEKQWVKTPEMSFEDCLDLVFKRFGVFGFMDVVQERKNALTKKYYSLIWREFIKFMHFPKLLLIICGTVLLYSLLQAFILPKWLFLGSFGLLFFVLLVRTFIINNRYKKEIKRTGNKWLLEEIIYKIGNLPIILNLLLQLFIQFCINEFEFNSLSPYLILLISFVIVLFGIMLYIAFIHLPKNIAKYLHKTYPEYQLENV